MKPLVSVLFAATTLNDGSLTPFDRHWRKHGHEKKSSSSMMAQRTRPWQLPDSSLPEIFPSSRNKTRVLPQPGIKPLSFARGITFSGLDADDLLSPDKVAKQMASAQECQDTRRLLSSGWGYFMYRPSRAQFLRSVESGRLIRLIPRHPQLDFRDEPQTRRERGHAVRSLKG